MKPAPGPRRLELHRVCGGLVRTQNPRSAYAIQIFGGRLRSDEDGAAVRPLRPLHEHIVFAARLRKLLASGDLADHSRAHALGLKMPHNRVGAFFAHNRDHANTHVESRLEVRERHISPLADRTEHRTGLPRATANVSAAIGGNHTGKIRGKATARHMGECVEISDARFLEYAQDLCAVDVGRG